MTERKIPIVSAFFVGLIMTSLGLFIFLGENFLPLIFVSIICTFGISLVIWLPLCWLVGYITLSIFYWINSQFNQSPSPNDQNKNQNLLNANNNQIYAIVDYIKKAQAKGYSNSQIEIRLKEKGWSITEIEQAFQLLVVQT